MRGDQLIYQPSVAVLGDSLRGLWCFFKGMCFDFTLLARLDSVIVPQKWSELIPQFVFPVNLPSRGSIDRLSSQCQGNLAGSCPIQTAHHDLQHKGSVTSGLLNKWYNLCCYQLLGEPSGQWRSNTVQPIYLFIIYCRSLATNLRNCFLYISRKIVSSIIVAFNLGDWKTRHRADDGLKDELKTSWKTGKGVCGNGGEIVIRSWGINAHWFYQQCKGG